MTNIARGKAKCYICHEILIKSYILSYKRSGSALSVLLYFELKNVLTEYIPLKFNTFNEYIYIYIYIYIYHEPQ